MIHDERLLTGNKIGVFGKGGSGKSTVVVMLARVLAERGYDVCVLDADSTNVGLHRAFGLEISPAPLMEYFGGTVFSGGAVTCPVDDPTPLSGAKLEVDALPEQYYARTRNGILLLAAGKIGGQGPGAGCDGPISKIARDLKLTENGEQFVMLVDFKAGFEDTARGVVTSVDLAIVVVDPTSAGIQMAADMKAIVGRIRAGELPATQHLRSPILVEMANRLFREATIKDVLFVLNKVEDEEMEDYICHQLAREGIEPIGAIHRNPSITTAWLMGTPIEGNEVSQEARRIAVALEKAEGA
jgi:CO dehydrogenase maturation factor